MEIGEQDIKLAMRAIKTGKAGGTDGIVGELVKYGGEALGISNYRPIAVINILAKLFGWLINEKMKRWVRENKVLDEEQRDVARERTEH